MSGEDRTLLKTGSTDSIVSDNINQTLPIKDDTHKSLENVYLDGPSDLPDTYRMTGKSESMINFQVFGEETASDDFATTKESATDVPEFTEESEKGTGNQDAMPVGFEEPTISRPLATVDSARSLMKFFIESPASGGEDLEGKSFFDSFTTTTEQEGLLSFKSEEQALASASTRPLPSPCDLNLTKVDDPKLDNNIKTSTNTDFVLSSNLERCADVWLPSEKTRQSLLTVLYNGPNVIVPFPTSELTMPAVIIEESMGDPIRVSVLKHIGEQEADKRLMLDVDSVPQDHVGLQQLIRADCLRAAVDLTRRLLTACGQGPGKMNQLSTHTPHSIQLWFCRLSLLARLNLYGPAECEWQPFGNLDNPDLYYDFHQSRFPGKRGSMVPFEMRILHAEFPQYLQRHQDSLDRLYAMVAVVTKIIKNLKSNLFEDGSKGDMSETDRKESLSLWESRELRALYCIANCLLAMKDHNNSLKVLRILLIKDAIHQDQIHCVMGRIYLQIGDIERAKHEFGKVSSQSEKDFNAQKLINEGLVELGNSEFHKAMQLFRKVYEQDKDNILALNNMCVSLLYLEKLKDSLKQLELLIYTTPKLYLQEILILNLCTMYELESSKATVKKQNLLRLTSQHKGTGFNAACLKLV